MKHAKMLQTKRAKQKHTKQLAKVAKDAKKLGNETVKTVSAGAAKRASA